jgi:signal transduction histidine kinase
MGPSNGNTPCAEPNRLNILLVDDEINVLRSLKRILREEGYNIITAQSGPDALEIMHRQPVELIVSDQRMVPMTGIEFLLQARELAPDAIRILLTGYSDVATAENAINHAEIYRFLTKPWNDSDFKSTIRQGLNKYRLELDNRRLYHQVEQQNLALKQWANELERLVEERTAQLNEAHSHLIQSEKMASLGTMAGGVAHEINNPLGGILGITQVLLSERGAEPRLIEDLKMIEQATLHCSAIVKNLLAFSRHEDTATRAPADLSQMLEQVILLIGHLFRQNDIRIVRDIPSDFPRLLVNPKQFQQVLVNLMVNAQQATGRDGKVIVRASHGAEGVCLEVRDQGPGIPEGIIEKIFDPFFTTKAEGEGTGLGLSVAYRIVEEHGGRIEVDSVMDQGACLRLIFSREIILETGEQRELAAGPCADGREPMASKPRELVT